MSASADFKVECVVAERQALSGRGKEYLTKWTGYPETDNTWEPLAHFGKNHAALRQFRATPAFRFEFYSAKYDTWFPSNCNDELLAHFAEWCKKPSGQSIFTFNDGRYIRSIDFNAPNPFHTSKTPKHPTMNQMNRTSRAGRIRPVRLVAVTDEQ